jgi:hypothetical protein
MAEDQQDDTAETPAVGAAAAKEAEQSPADAQRGGEGRPEEPAGAAVSDTVGDDKPEGTGLGGSVRGGYGLGATGEGGDRDVRGPSSTGGASGGLSPLEAQRRAEEAKDAFSEKPHVFVGAAFVGGLLFAQILKRFGGGDDD